VDKVQDLLITVSAALAALCAWIVKRLWGRLDKIESRVDHLYSDRLKKSDLDKIIDIQHLILQNLLTKKPTDKDTS
jgi:hypothetical protein